MSKIKSVARRLLGKPAPKPFTIDSVASTVDGFCVVGWYFSDEVKHIQLVDTEKSPLKSNVLNIERADVTQATGKKATGFQLTITTDIAINELLLLVESKNGQQFTSALTLMGEAVAVVQNDIDVAAMSASKVKATCEYAIYVEGYLFLAGWILDGGRTNDFTLSIKNKEISDAELLRYTRSDVVKAFANETEKTSGAGFMLVFKLPDVQKMPSVKDVELSFFIDDEEEQLSPQSVFNGKTDPMTNVQRLLNPWQPNSPQHLAKGEMLLPMLYGIYPTNTNTSVKVHTYNTLPSSPTFSLIIPLYGRIDFMRYQLSNFSRTLNASQVEVIYVLDDPKLANQTLALAREMETITGFPFKLLILGKNVGFGRANNIGVEHASAPTLLLLNSDILPKNKGWLTSLHSSLSNESVGIVGARLLFEDETIQHDGMAPMRVPEYPGLVFNDHPKKGWPKSLAPYSQFETECQLITAACWMLRKDDFNAVGGFDPLYVLGDFEDSDVCLKIEALGKKNVIRHDIELYHLERQSQNLVQPGRWKHNITVLNAITYNKKWKDELTAMEEKV